MHTTCAVIVFCASPPSTRFFIGHYSTEAASGSGSPSRESPCICSSCARCRSRLDETGIGWGASGYHFKMHVWCEHVAEYGSSADGGGAALLRAAFEEAFLRVGVLPVSVPDFCQSTLYRGGRLQAPGA